MNCIEVLPSSLKKQMDRRPEYIKYSLVIGVTGNSLHKHLLKTITVNVLSPKVCQTVQIHFAQNVRYYKDVMG